MIGIILVLLASISFEVWAIISGWSPFFKIFFGAFVIFFFAIFICRLAQIYKCGITSMKIYKR